MLDELLTSRMIQTFSSPISVLDVELTCRSGRIDQMEKQSSPPLKPQRWLSFESNISNIGSTLQPIRPISPITKMPPKSSIFLSAFQPQMSRDMTIDSKNDTTKFDVKVEKRSTLKTNLKPPMLPQRSMSIESSFKKGRSGIHHMIPFNDFENSKTSLKPPTRPKRSVSIEFNFIEGPDSMQFNDFEESKTSLRPPMQPQRSMSIESNLAEERSAVHHSMLLNNPEDSDTTNESKQIKKKNRVSNLINKEDQFQIPFLLSTKYNSVISVSALTLETYEEELTVRRRRSSRYSLSSRSPSILALIDENDTFLQPRQRDNADDVDGKGGRNVDIVLPGLDREWNRVNAAWDARSFSFSRASSVSSCTFECSSNASPNIVVPVFGFTRATSDEVKSQKERSAVAPIPPQRQGTLKSIQP